MKILFIFSLLFLTLSSPCYAYLGPGLGAGTIGIIIGFIASIFLALFAIIWYPMKRLFKKKKTEKASENVEK